MDKAELRETLEQLRGDLRNLRFHDPQSPQRVQQLISAIERQIDAADDDPARLAATRETLASAVSQFEAEHPKLSFALGRIVDALSSMGI